MPKPKMADVLEENKRLHDENFTQYMALMYVAGGLDADVTERYTVTDGDDRVRMTVQLFGATRNDGGYLVEVEAQQGQRPQVRAFRPTDYFRLTAHAALVMSAYNIARRDAADRIRAAQTALINNERAA